MGKGRDIAQRKRRTSTAEETKARAAQKSANEQAGRAQARVQDAAAVQSMFRGASGRPAPDVQRAADTPAPAPVLAPAATKLTPGQGEAAPADPPATARAGSPSQPRAEIRPDNVGCTEEVDLESTSESVMREYARGVLERYCGNRCRYVGSRNDGAVSALHGGKRCLLAAFFV